MTGTRINLNLKSADWELLHQIRQDNGLSLNKTCRMLIELGIMAYTLNEDLIDYI